MPVSGGIHGDKAPPIFSPIKEEEPGDALSSLPDTPAPNEGGPLLDSLERPPGLNPASPEFETSFESQASDIGPVRNGTHLVP